MLSCHALPSRTLSGTSYALIDATVSHVPVQKQPPKTCNISRSSHCAAVERNGSVHSPRRRCHVAETQEEERHARQDTAGHERHVLSSTALYNNLFTRFTHTIPTNHSLTCTVLHHRLKCCISPPLTFSVLKTISSFPFLNSPLRSPPFLQHLHQYFKRRQRSRRGGRGAWWQVSSLPVPKLSTFVPSSTFPLKRHNMSSNFHPLHPSASALPAVLCNHRI
jgi:hypothetical protein